MRGQGRGVSERGDIRGDKEVKEGKLGEKSK